MRRADHIQAHRLPSLHPRTLLTAALCASAVPLSACLPSAHAAASAPVVATTATPTAGAPQPGLLITVPGLRDCQPSVPYARDVVAVLCKQPAQDTRRDFGLRLFLVQASAAGQRVVFRAKEAGGDAYTGQLQLFDLKAADGQPTPRLIFASFAAEYPYGTLVYADEAGKGVRSVGRIDAIGIDNDGDPVSAMAYAEPIATADGAVIRFSRKLVQPRGDGNYGDPKTVSYTYSSAKGRLVMDRR